MFGPQTLWMKSQITYVILSFTVNCAFRRPFILQFEFTFQGGKGEFHDCPVRGWKGSMKT